MSRFIYKQINAALAPYLHKHIDFLHWLPERIHKKPHDSEAADMEAFFVVRSRWTALLTPPCQQLGVSFLSSPRSATCTNRVFSSFSGQQLIRRQRNAIFSNRKKKLPVGVARAHAHPPSTGLPGAPPTEAVGVRFEVAIPLSERSPSSVASLTDVLQWRKQAQDLASSVGSDFMDADGGPEVNDLWRELEWFLDDSVGGCGCWTEHLDVQSSSWKICSWRDIKDGYNLKLDNGKVKVHGMNDDLKATAEDIFATFGTFADLSRERHGDPVTEFATDCGCSCDGIREDLLGSFEELESRSSTLSTSTLNKLIDIQNPANSNSKDRHGLQLLLKMSLPDMDSAWKERILKRRPFQFVVATAHWRDLILSVMEGVLIPRPETEQLIDIAEVAISNDESLAHGVWADLGTGSGAIAISLARLLHPPGSVVAIDASTTAVVVARRNVERYRLQNKVNVVQGFWFSSLQVKVGELAGVISNPPYIPTENLESLQAEVGKHEPKIALDGGPDGADDLREICNGSAMVLRSGGFLALETNGGHQAEAIRDYLCQMRVLERSGTPVSCFHDVKCVKDFAGVMRFVTAMRH